MKVAFFSAYSYDARYFSAHNTHNYECVFYKESLSINTVTLAKGFDAVTVVSNDEICASTLKLLKSYDVKVVALRCAGFNNIDVRAAKQLHIPVVRVPEYSPEAIAEHAVALLLTLNRKTHKAYNRVREGNFSLQGLMGYNVHQKTVGVIGTGHIGLAFCRIMKGFGCRVIAYDPKPSQDTESLGVELVAFGDLIRQSDIISLHCPLNDKTHYLINNDVLEQVKPGVVIINTSRGGLIDTRSAIAHLKNGKLGALGLDVYEQEGQLFFKDLSDTIIQDDVLERLTTFPNVMITAHQAFFTHEALTEIARTTLNNIACIAAGNRSGNEIEW